mmetsp:Transcript_5568/g.16109  ORF Transcript_5568/g.16109 Transcript_5568/m.16109 type:complete len:260 (-) Transcript_5568:479-1258(-)
MRGREAQSAETELPLPGGIIASAPRLPANRLGQPRPATPALVHRPAVPQEQCTGRHRHASCLPSPLQQQAALQFVRESCDLHEVRATWTLRVCHHLAVDFSVRSSPHYGRRGTFSCRWPDVEHALIAIPMLQSDTLIVGAHIGAVLINVWPLTVGLHRRRTGRHEETVVQPGHKVAGAVQDLVASPHRGQLPASPSKTALGKAPLRAAASLTKVSYRLQWPRPHSQRWPTSTRQIWRRRWRFINRSVPCAETRTSFQRL